LTNPEYQFLKPEKPKRRWLKPVVISVVVALVGGMLVAGGGAVWILSRLAAAGIDIYSTDGETFDIPTAEEINGPINMLLIGSDTREGQGSTEYGPAGAELADVMILLHINQARTSAVALSFPRDLMVAMPECPNPDGGDPYPAKEYVQINSTIKYGGPACTLLTIQKLTGVRIPYLAMVDFKGVIEMTSEIGGVTVCVAQDINDDYTKLYLEAGEHTLSGKQALAFLRTRHGVGDGSDLSRISNQQVYLTAMVRKLKEEGAFTNPFTLFRLGTAAIENMTLSRSLTNLGVMFGIAGEVNDVDLDKIVFLKLPIYGLTGEYAGRVGLATERANFIFEKIIADEALVLAKPNPGSGAVVEEDPNATTEPAPEDALPEWAQGTTAATKSCSK
jgi:LCP family protein required for cell wall assembly